MFLNVRCSKWTLSVVIFVKCFQGQELTFTDAVISVLLIHTVKHAHGHLIERGQKVPKSVRLEFHC